MKTPSVEAAGFLLGEGGAPGTPLKNAPSPPEGTGSCILCPGASLVLGLETLGTPFVPALGYFSLLGNQNFEVYKRLSGPSSERSPPRGAASRGGGREEEPLLFYDFSRSVWKAVATEYKGCFQQGSLQGARSKEAILAIK